MQDVEPAHQEQVNYRGVPTYLKVGIHTNVLQYTAALRKQNSNVGAAARTILLRDSFICLRRPIDLMFRIISVEHLGYPEGGLHKQVMQTADDRCLHLCPAEVGPAACLAPPVEFGEGTVVIAMKPVKNPANNMLIFSVETDESDPLNGVWLHARPCTPNTFWGPKTRFVFRG